MWYEYNLGNDSLDISFQKLQQARDKAQDQIGTIVHMIAYENIFKKTARIITGYNHHLLRRYMTLLDTFVVKASDAIRSYEIIGRSLNDETYKSRICTAVDWCIYLYYDILKDKKTFKEKQNSELINTFDEMLNNVNELLYHAITRVDHEDHQIQQQENANVEQKRGYIDINQYMIDYF